MSLVFCCAVSSDKHQKIPRFTGKAVTSGMETQHRFIDEKHDFPLLPWLQRYFLKSFQLLYRPHPPGRHICAI